MQIDYRTVAFGNLTTHELYDLLSLRAEVFVVEQNCAYQDLDGKDAAALHVLGETEDGRLASYTRLLPRGVSYPNYHSIGRVVTAEFARGLGLGRPLMQYSASALWKHFGPGPIKISAQAHLQAFYRSCGYRPVGDIYDEDGIPHIAMLHSTP